MQVCLIVWETRTWKWRVSEMRKIRSWITRTKKSENLNPRKGGTARSLVWTSFTDFVTDFIEVTKLTSNTTAEKSTLKFVKLQSLVIICPCKVCAFYIFYTAEAKSFPTWSIILLNAISNYLLFNIFLYISIRYPGQTRKHCCGNIVSYQCFAMFPRVGKH